MATFHVYDELRTRLSDGPSAATLGAQGIAVGILSNTILKLAIEVVLGRGSFRRAGPGLLALGAATGLGFWIAG